MTLLVKTVPINTDAEGAAVATVRAGGCLLRAVHVEVGDLEAFDLTVTEEPLGRTLLGLEAVEADARFQPMIVGQNTDGTDVSTNGGHVIPAILKRIQIVIANGGDHKSGELTLLLER